MGRRFLLSLLLLSAPALGASPPYGEGHILHIEEDDNAVDKRLSLLDKKVSLSPDQMHNAQEALADEHMKMGELEKEYRDARRKIIDDTDGALRAVLNPEQQQKFESFKSDIIGKPDASPDRPGRAGERAY